MPTSERDPEFTVYTVKEILGRMERKLDNLDDKMDQKADAGAFRVVEQAAWTLAAKVESHLKNHEGYVATKRFVVPLIIGGTGLVATIFFSILSVVRG